MTAPSIPTGLTTTAFKNKIEIRWVKNPETNISGYNIYNSTTSGGGETGYVKLNETLIEELNQVRQDVVNSTTTTEVVGGTKTTTTVENLTETAIFLYSHENLTEGKVQYYVVTAVNDLGEEGPTSIEVNNIPFIVPTEIIEPPLRTQQDVSLDYISTLLEREPKLDVKPGTVTRQLHIDPNSYEFSLAYIRVQFNSIAQSFLTLRVFDDADDDGVSDPVSTDTNKQLLKSAYFFETDEITQIFIDEAFDKLASNTGNFRDAATKSTGTATFYTTLQPTADITVNSGTEISTIPSEIEDAITFITLSDITMDFDNIDTYFNDVTQRYEIEVAIEAVVAGSSGNVNANTIVNTDVSGLQVTNVLATINGSDEESNSDLADRSQLSFTGLDVGTATGYEKTVVGIPNVTDVKIVDAGDPLMQRDYDEVRKKHVFGKVDVYIRGGTPVQFQDTVGFLFNQNINEQFQIIDVTDFIIQTNNSEVTVSKPIFSVSDISNITQGQDYDLLGNWTIQKNAIEMIKTTEVSVDLTTGEITFEDPLVFGDVITADYDYKVTVTGESVIDPAIGGEVNFTLDNIPVVKNSYTIYKNGIALTETTDYTLTLSNGFLQLTSGLAPGDVLTADYKYIVNVVGEIVISSAAGDETTANLTNFPVFESLTIQSDGISLDIEETNTINASIGMLVTDVIKVTYRYRDSDPILLLNQPASEVTSVVGSISGELTEGTNYTFDNIDDILLEGNSVKAVRTVQITFFGGIPIGDVSDATEEIVLVNNEYTALGQKGIDTETIVVKSGTTTYVKNVDYLIRDEEDGINVSLARSVTSTIPNGSTITVTYEYGELLTITYNVNPLVTEVQKDLEPVRHITADVLVKEVLETKVDFDFSVVLKANSDPVIVSSNIVTALTNEFAKHKLGVGIAQSDVIRIIELVTNVESVLVPLTKMVKADGTQINRESIYTEFVPYQSSIVNSYTTNAGALLQSTLGSNASDGFYAIYEDDRPLIFVTNANDVDNASGQGFISSSGEIIVSTIDNDDPSAHKYTVSYVVNGETGAKDIVITSLEYISIGTINITTA